MHHYAQPLALNFCIFFKASVFLWLGVIVLFPKSIFWGRFICKSNMFTLLEWLDLLHKPFSYFCVCFNVWGAHVDIRMPLWSHFSPSTYFKLNLPGLPGKCFCALSYLASPSCVLCLGKQKILCVPALLQVLHHYLFLGRHLSKCDPVAAHLYELHTTWSAVFYPSLRSQKRCVICQQRIDFWVHSLLAGHQDACSSHWKVPFATLHQGPSISISFFGLS